MKRQRERRAWLHNGLIIAMQVCAYGWPGMHCRVRSFSMACCPFQPMSATLPAWPQPQLAPPMSPTRLSQAVLQLPSLLCLLWYSSMAMAGNIRFESSTSAATIATSPTSVYFYGECEEGAARIAFGCSACASARRPARRPARPPACRPAGLPAWPVPLIAAAWHPLWVLRISTDCKQASKLLPSVTCPAAYSMSAVVCQAVGFLVSLFSITRRCSCVRCQLHAPWLWCIMCYASMPTCLGSVYPFTQVPPLLYMRLAAAGLVISTLCMLWALWLPSVSAMPSHAVRCG